MHRTAIVYDFDGTLARGNIQEHSLLPQLEVDKAAFWAEVKRLAQEHDADEILIYMWRMLEAARAKSFAVTKDALRQHGASTPLFKGVDTWFDRLSLYASERNLHLDHYVISSWNDQLIRSCSVARKFREV